MKSKVITNRRHLSFLTDVSLDVDEVLDALSRIDYDYLVEELTTRKLMEPSESVTSRRSISSTVEEDYLQALDKLKFKYLQLDKEKINYIINLANNS